MAVLDSKYTITKREGLTLIRILDEISYDEALIIMDRLASEKLYHFRCYDLRKGKISFTHDQVKEMAAYSKHLFTEPNRYCLVVKDNFMYGIIRSYLAYRDESEHAKMTVFRRLDEGLQWLKNEQETINDVNGD